MLGCGPISSSAISALPDTIPVGDPWVDITYEVDVWVTVVYPANVDVVVSLAGFTTQ